MMKLNVQKRCFLFVLCMVLVLPLLSLSVFAGVDPSTVDEDGFVTWEVSEDGNKLVGEGKEYSLYLPVSDFYYYEEAAFLYSYRNPATFSEFNGVEKYRASVVAPYRGSEFVLVRAGETYIYATERGKAQLAELFSGNSKNYFLRTAPFASAPLGFEQFDAMEAERAKSDNKKTVEVKSLQKSHLFDVIVYDDTMTLAYTVGAVYRLDDGKDYYVHYLSLGNQYFDAEGNFSYRSGSVALTVLGEDLSRELDKVREQVVPNGYTYYEYEDSETPLFSETTFWVLYSIMGFVAPVPLFILGLVLPYSKKRGYPKYWRILSVIAALWILFAAILMILLM